MWYINLKEVGNQMSKYTEYQVRVDGITQCAFATQEGADVAVKHLIEISGVEAERITVKKVESI